MIIEIAKESTTGATTKIVPTTTQAAPLPPHQQPPNFGKRGRIKYIPISSCN